MRATRPLLALSFAGLVLSPGLFAEQQSMQEAMDAYRANLEKLRSQGWDLGNVGKAFEEVQRGAEQGKLPLPGVRLPIPGGGEVEGGVDEHGSAGRLRLPDGGWVEGQAGEDSASGTVELPGGLKVRGNAGPDGAGGTVELPGGWKIQGNAGSGMPSGDITGPNGQSLSGMLGKMFQGMNEGGMYTAGIRGLQTTVAMLKSNGLDTQEVEGKIQQLLPQLEQLDALSKKMIELGAQGKAPPEKLVQELELRSTALDPQMEALTEEIESMTENLGGSLRRDIMGDDYEEYEDESPGQEDSSLGQGLQKGLEGLGNLMKGWGK